MFKLDFTKPLFFGSQPCWWLNIGQSHVTHPEMFALKSAMNDPFRNVCPLGSSCWLLHSWNWLAFAKLSRAIFRERLRPEPCWCTLIARAAEHVFTVVSLAHFLTAGKNNLGSQDQVGLKSALPAVTDEMVNLSSQSKMFSGTNSYFTFR